MVKPYLIEKSDDVATVRWSRHRYGLSGWVLLAFSVGWLVLCAYLLRTVGYEGIVSLFFILVGVFLLIGSVEMIFGDEEWRVFHGRLDIEKRIFGKVYWRSRLSGDTLHLDRLPKRSEHEEITGYDWYLSLYWNGKKRYLATASARDLLPLASLVSDTSGWDLGPQHLVGLDHEDLLLRPAQATSSTLLSPAKTSGAGTIETLVAPALAPEADQGT